MVGVRVHSPIGYKISNYIIIKTQSRNQSSNRGPLLRDKIPSFLRWGQDLENFC